MVLILCVLRLHEKYFPKLGIQDLKSSGGNEKQFGRKKFLMEKKKKKLPKFYCRCKADGIFGKRIEEKLWLKNLESLTTFF